MQTNRSTASIANLGRARSRREVSAALTTLLDRRAVGKAPRLNKVGILLPKQIVGRRVARRAKCFKVAQVIGNAIVIEQMKRPLVMHWLTWRNVSAMLTSIVITQSRCFALAIPVRPAIIYVAAEPRCVIRASESARTSPNKQAGITTEIARTNLARTALNFCTAYIALNSGAVAIQSNTGDFLPLAITYRVAEMMVARCELIRLAMKRFSALGTVNLHTRIITRLGY